MITKTLHKIVSLVILSALPTIAYAYDGSCIADTDCGGGVKCLAGMCANAPNSMCFANSDCGPGVACNTGKCATAAWPGPRR